MRHLDLFSGIGGFALATEMVWQNVEHIFCDNDAFSQAVLKKHWPNSVIYGDIKELKNPPTADLVTGGFPCQPFSAAGERRGTEDDRHLWPEMFRVIRESAPRWIIAENVGGLLTWDGGMVLKQVCTDLENADYEVWPFVLPAVAVNAPHRRDRVWVIGHAKSERRHDGPTKDHGQTTPQVNTSGNQTNVRQPTSDSNDQGYERRRSNIPSNPQRMEKDHQERVGARCTTPRCNKNCRHASYAEGIGRVQGQLKQLRPLGEPSPLDRSAWDESWPAAATRLCVVDDGLSGGLVRPRGWRNAALKGAGNAIVPQVAAEIMRAIKEINP